MAATYLAYFSGQAFLYHKGLHEFLALPVLALSAIIFLFCAIGYRFRFAALLAGLAAAFFCREWHFPGTGVGIYIYLVCAAFWAYSWREEIFKVLQNRPLKIWFIATGLTYFLSQFIARRAFRSLYLPLEEQLHVPFEEVVETTAHIMLLIAGIRVWRYARKKSSEIQHPSEDKKIANIAIPDKI